MISKEFRSRGVCTLGWTVIGANVCLYFAYYFDLSVLPIDIARRVVSFISMLAVFPDDLFHTYFSTQWQPQIIWVMVVVASAFGILSLNKFSRAVFMLLNAVQIVVLAYLVFLKLHTPEILNYFFKLYFTTVASGSYIIYLTLPEVRKQFHVEMAGLKLQILLQKPLGKKVVPSDAKKYAGLSAAYLRLERYEEAAEAMNKAIQGAPDNAGYYFQLGMIQIKQQFFLQAFESFRIAIEKDPIHYEAHYNLGILYTQQGCGHEAVEIFQRARRIRPKEAQIYRELGDAYFSIKEYERSVQYFRQAVSLSKNDAYSYYRMGCILTEYLDRHQEGLEALRATVGIDKSFCDAHFQLGKVCIKLKRYKDAVRAFKDVIALQSDHVQGRYHLGFVYAILKDFQSARRQCSFLRGQDPDLAENLSLLLSSL